MEESEKITEFLSTYLWYYVVLSQIYNAKCELGIIINTLLKPDVNNLHVQHTGALCCDWLLSHFSGDTKFHVFPGYFQVKSNEIPRQLGFGQLFVLII